MYPNEIDKKLKLKNNKNIFSSSNKQKPNFKTISECINYADQNKIFAFLTWANMVLYLFTKTILF